MTIQEQIQCIRKTLPQGVTLVCVSKYHSEEAVMEAYNAGERDFGESRVQELLTKYEHLPKDIRWHMIGHLQTNKVKAIVPFVHLIHSVDSERLLQVINREAEKIQRVVPVLIEVHVAQEQTKSGMSIDEAYTLCTANRLPWVEIRGLMTMATNTDDEQEIRRCFATVKNTLNRCGKKAAILSMGMSDDYPIAIEEGSNMVRIGSKIFGAKSI
ncbi:MAG: YggS family pyridoxal phosphate-dependent enzyme [Paludibacteraceae bacterium]|nr:YggS family pyridoxal phosphate-dependent enzyme [Paludibacteraceae bacterium]